MKNKIILQIFIVMVLLGLAGCEEKVLLEDKINFIYSSSVDDLWIATSNGIYMVKNGKYDEAKNIRKGEMIRGISEDTKSNIYFGAGKNVVSLNAENEEKIIEPLGMGRDNSYVQCVAVDKNDNLWIGRENDLLVKYNGEKYKTYPIWNVNGIDFSADGDIWVSEKSSLYRIRNNVVEEFDQDNSILQGFEINDLLVDDYDNLWIATNSGLVKYNNHVWIIYNTENSKLIDNQVSLVHWDKNGSLIVGMRSGDIQLIKNNKWQKINLGVKDQTINAIYKDSKDLLMLGTDSGLLVSK